MTGSDATRKLKNMVCKNKQCREALCTSDGEFIYINGLEVAPKITAKYVDLVCDKCGDTTRWRRTVADAQESS